MRELTARIRFTKHSLGNDKLRDGTGRFVFSRSPITGQIVFLASWHAANMRMAAQILGRHQDDVKKINWDINIDGVLRADHWYRCYATPKAGGRRNRYSLHEAFFPGECIGINCCVPPAISDDDFWFLLSKAGQYRGLSPWKPGEHGHFVVESIKQRVAPAQEDDSVPPFAPTDRFSEVPIVTNSVQ